MMIIHNTTHKILTRHVHTNTNTTAMYSYIHRSARKASYEKLLVFFYALLASGLGDLAEVGKTTLLKIGIEF